MIPTKSYDNLVIFLKKFLSTKNNRYMYYNLQTGKGFNNEG